MRIHHVRSFLVGVLVAGSLVAAAPARASFHQMAIREIFSGTTHNEGADFVELTMLANSQNQVDGTRLRFFDSAGSPIGTDTLNDDLVNGQAGDTILIGTSSAGTLFGVTPDFTLATAVAGTGGKVCFGPAGGSSAPIDCASWGNYTGPAADSGAPFRGNHELPLGASMSRGGNSPNLDDSDDSRDDFLLDGPTPRTFAGVAGSVPGSVFSMSQETLEVTEGQKPLAVAVNRSGNTAETGAVTMIGRPGTASKGDFTLTSGFLNYPVSDTLENATLDVVDDDEVEPPETFNLLLTLPEDSGQDGSVTDDFVEVSVTITDNEVDTNAPTSSITKPEDGKSYRPGQLGTFKGLASDGNEIGIESIEIALRKNLKRGRCKWLKGNGEFVKRGCSDRKFLDAQGKAQWNYELQAPLLPSVDSKVKSYDLFSRARDKAGNVEQTFNGPNSSHFEVSPPR